MNPILKLVEHTIPQPTDMTRFTPDSSLRIVYSSLINSNVKTAQYLANVVVPRGWDTTKYNRKLEANNAALRVLCEAMLLLEEDHTKIMCTCTQGTVGDVLDLTMTAIAFTPMASTPFRYEPINGINAPALCSAVFNKLGEKFGAGRCECCRDDVNQLVMRVVNITQ